MKQQQKFKNFENQELKKNKLNLYFLNIFRFN